METNHEHFINRCPRANRRTGERGNALVYVLIAIALFAALSFTLARQGDSGETVSLADDRAEIYASDLISYSVQVKSVIDQMLFTGTKVGDLDFILPTAAGFSGGTQLDRTQRVYHPEGGGLNPASIPDDVATSEMTNPDAGWYLGRFNNVEWTPTAADDVILVAYQIRREVCEKINMKVKGTTAIPVLGDSIKEVMINAADYGGANTDFTTDPLGTPICGTCHKVSALCVQDQSLDGYAFYTVAADQ